MSTLEQKQLTKSILSAAEQGHKKSIQDFISRKVVNVLDEEGSTPLMYAAANGREEIIRLLLDKECIASNKLEYNTDTKYVDQQNIYGWTALMQAACYGHLSAVIHLIQRGANVSITNSWGAPALVGASQGGFYGVVHRLLNMGAEVNPEKNWESADTLTPLMAATQCGHLEIVQELLRRGANVETKLKGTRWTALMLAALNNQLPVMELLLQHGADKSATDINGQTAADLATALGHQDMAFLLTGQKPKKCTKVEFFEFIKSGDVDKVKTVLETQKSLANSKDKDGATPLMLAASRGNIKMCEVLLDRGADVNTTDDKYGWTALMLATHQKKYDVVKFLGERGADVTIRGKSGSTAFDVANMISDVQMIRLVANISVEQIQRKAPDATPPLTLPVLTGKLDAIQENIQPPPSDTSSKVGVAKPDTSSDVGGAKPDKGPEKETEPSFIDLTDLKHKLEKAYRTPTPNISVDNDQPMTKESPTESRFPRARMKSSSSARRLATPTSSQLPLSGSSEAPSLASSSSSSVAGASQTGDPFDRPPSSSSPSSFAPTPNKQGQAKRKPANLFLKGIPNNKGHSPSPKGTHPFLIPRSSSATGTRRPERTSQPSLWQPKVSPGAGKAVSNSLKSKLKETSTVSPKKVDRDVARRRADTAPVSPRKEVSKAKKRMSKPQPPPGMDLKTALNMESLGHLHTIFKQHEMDLESFMVLRGCDLREMGFDSENTELLLTLITKLSSPAMFTFH